MKSMKYIQTQCEADNGRYSMCKNKLSCRSCVDGSNFREFSKQKFTGKEKSPRRRVNAKLT